MIKGITCECERRMPMAECPSCSSLLPARLIMSLIGYRNGCEKNSYSVTELTRCLRQAYYMRTLDWLEPLERALSRLRGNAIHEMTRYCGWRELPVHHSLPFMGDWITIRGSVDLYDPEEATIYEIKTTTWLEWQSENGRIPHDGDVKQIRSYQFLLNKWGIPVRHLVLLYIDDKSIKRVEVSIEDSIGAWLTGRAKRLHAALKTNSPPDRELSRTCKYCPFLEVCDPYGSGPYATPTAQGQPAQNGSVANGH